MLLARSGKLDFGAVRSRLKPQSRQSQVASEELLQTPPVSFLGFSTGIGNALDRRQLLRASAVISVAASLPRLGAAETPGTAFGGSSVRDLSRVLASKGLERADDKVPVSVVFVCYEQY